MKGQLEVHEGDTVAMILCDTYIVRNKIRLC